MSEEQDRKVFAIAQGALWATPAVAAIIIFCFQTFQTKSDASAASAEISARQDRDVSVSRSGFERMDNKLDRLSEKVDRILMNQRGYKQGGSYGN